MKLIEKDFLGIVRLTGDERVSWLQGMVTNDVAKLKTGQGCYAGHLTAQGRLVAQMVILASAEDLWIETERDRVAPLMASLDKVLIMEDVQMSDVSGDYRILSVIGPGAEPGLRQWCGLSSESWPQRLYDHVETGGCRVVVCSLGFDTWIPREGAEAVRQSLLQAGAEPIDRSEWEVLRVEAGLPVYGLDMDESTIMPELGEQGIDYDKGCYIGQEVVAKVKYLGHVNRRLLGLRLQGNDVPPRQSRVMKAGREAGVVTSSVYSPSLKSVIALAMLSRNAAMPGAAVEVLAGEGGIPATVLDLPFISPLA